MRRALAALLCLMALPAGALAAPRTSLPDVEDEVMCPVCGVPLNLAEGAPQADRQRAFIQRLIDRGLSKEQIKRRLVDEYGPAVLATPERRGFSLAAYAVPIALGLGAFALLVLLLPRWARRGRAPAAAPARSLTEAEARRLDEDLASYDAR